MKPFSIPADILNISVILTAMPAAVNTVIFAEKYGGDSEWHRELSGYPQFFLATMLIMLALQ